MRDDATHNEAAASSAADATANGNGNVNADFAAAAAQRKLTQRVLIELLIFVAMTIPIAIFEFAIEPARRGFFCDDESIRYPYHGNTITPVLLGLIVGALPLLVFVLVELVRHKRAGELSTRVPLGRWHPPAWYVELGRQFVYFGFGLLLTFDATEVGKYTIGRLRPHFMAVCQPQLTDGSLCSDAANLHRYVENYDCAAVGYTVADVRQARLSFPSGHSSLAFYSLVYVALYLQRKLSWRSSKLIRHIAQFLLIMLAWYTALTRIMDNWHHWSDVLIGSLIGIVCALLTARYISKIFQRSYCEALPMGGLRRQDTAATLQEVCPSTPPPYCINGSYSDDQYCTKV